MDNLYRSFRKGNSMIINHRLISIPTLDELHRLPNKKVQLLALYKRFFKLRHMISERDYKKKIYINTIGYKFRLDSFDKINIRRALCLPGVRRLNDDDILQRTINSLAFVFNSTVEVPGGSEKGIVGTFKEFEPEVSMEKKILETIIEMERQKPNEIKYDMSYNWILPIERIYNEIPTESSFKQFRKSFKGLDPCYVGFVNYERGLQRLNESIDLLL